MICRCGSQSSPMARAKIGPSRWFWRIAAIEQAHHRLDLRFADGIGAGSWRIEHGLVSVPVRPLSMRHGARLCSPATAASPAKTGPFGAFAMDSAPFFPYSRHNCVHSGFRSPCGTTRKRLQTSVQQRPGNRDQHPEQCSIEKIRTDQMNIIQQLNAEHVEELPPSASFPTSPMAIPSRCGSRFAKAKKSACRPMRASLSPSMAAASPPASPCARSPTAKAWNACSPLFAQCGLVEVLKRGKVRRAKLYYLRDRRGKSARIFESTNSRTKKIEATERTAALEAKKPAKLKRSQPPRPLPPSRPPRTRKPQPRAAAAASCRREAPAES